MMSKWSDLKPKVISLRRKGTSMTKIEREFGIPRSTLSGWFKHVKLTPSQKKLLQESTSAALRKARLGALNWHYQQKIERLKIAENEANKTLARIKINNDILELGLAILYLGEGSKKNCATSMGNSDPLILKFFLKSIQTIYNMPIEKFKFYLHLRSDQSPDLMKKYWSEELGVSMDSFKGVSLDKRTIKTKTYAHYKGVCVVSCGNVAIQRKLVYISRKFCEEMTKNTRG